jgi:tripartite ATP-independent transporter DctM subunit
MLGLLYGVFILVYAWLRPGVAPAPKDAERVNLRLVLRVLKSTIPPTLLIVAVLGSIFMGIATPTEASGVGALGATLLAVARRRLSFAGLQDVLQGTMKTTSYIFALFVGATAFALVLRGFGGDELIEDALTSLPFGPSGVVVVILAIAFVLGFVLDWIEITLILLPLIAPVLLDMDVNLVWFAVLFAVTLQTSFITPPVGFALFYMKGVAPKNVTTGTIYKGIIPFMIIQLIAVGVIFFFPSLATWLPAVAYGL